MTNGRAGILIKNYFLSGLFPAMKMSKTCLDQQQQSLSFWKYWSAWFFWWVRFSTRFWLQYSSEGVDSEPALATGQNNLYSDGLNSTDFINREKSVFGQNNSLLGNFSENFPLPLQVKNKTKSTVILFCFSVDCSWLINQTGVNPMKVRSIVRSVIFTPA